jgi:glycosyltransferase involved in cell wall biosynthesis
MQAISIITAVRNGLPLIEWAFQSIRAQSFADFEWLVVDDGSTDGTYEALRAWTAEDSRIRLLRHEQNRGTAAARNTAVRAARGEFVSYLDHDDEYYPGYLAQVVQFRDTTTPSAISTSTIGSVLPCSTTRSPVAPCGTCRPTASA